MADPNPYIEVIVRILGGWRAYDVRGVMRWEIPATGRVEPMTEEEADAYLHAREVHRDRTLNRYPPHPHHN